MLAGCFESAPKLYQEDEKLLDAATYLFSGLEDNLDETGGKGMPWQRAVKGRAIEYWRISENGIGFSDDELNKKTRGSRYVRYIYRIGSPEPCSFTFEDITEFSNRESQEDFSAFSTQNSANGMTFNVGNLTRGMSEIDRRQSILAVQQNVVMCPKPTYLSP